jgi:hypothetical protein
MQSPETGSTTQILTQGLTGAGAEKSMGLI